jgi:hypothetical protein
MTTDIRQIGGIWCIDICLNNRPETASLKTPASHRPVPLHSRLFAEGFLDYHRSLPEGSLFPELRIAAVSGISPANMPQAGSPNGCAASASRTGGLIRRIAGGTPSRRCTTM